MSYHVYLSTISRILLMFSPTFLIPAAVAYIYSERPDFFLIPFFAVIFLASLFFLLTRKKIPETTEEGEAYISVAIIWLLIPAFGSIPFILHGINPLDSFFESVSGFTTTGTTVITPENLPLSLLFWRSFMQWLGGFGIVLFALVFIPSIKRSSALFMAEYPAVVLPKTKPKMRDMAIAIFRIYLVLTIAEIFILNFLGLDFFKAVVHTFSTVSTGGFSTSSESIAAFKDIRIEAVVAFFAFLGGMNFGLIYALTNKQLRSLADLEFRYYLFIIVLAILSLTAINLNRYGFLESLRYSSFQVISIMTTTGFTTTNFEEWSSSAKMILLILMLIGGCSGSTAGGFKVIRAVILIKYTILQIYKIIEPRAVRTVKYGDFAIEKEMIEEVIVFFILYISIFIASSLVLTLIGYDFETSMSLSATSLGNVGPAFGIAAKSAAELSWIAKVVLIINMWMGRLEIIPVFTFLVSVVRREKW
ncbi:MAG: TrkH family potassium uptake protein [Archaeoglobales archaeon]|nr:TrkH family potassium uptake protein [Archaeoglobales archaeon]